VQDAPLEMSVAPGRRAAATFIFLTVTLDMLAMGMIVPVLPKLIQGFEGGSAALAATMIGIFGFMFAGIQFVFSPVLGGALGNVNPRLPFWVAAGLSLLNGMYGLFVLPESLKAEHRQKKINWGRANPIGSLALFTRVQGLLPLAGLLTLGYIAQQSLMSTYMIYVYTRYSWSVRTGGLSLAVVGVVTGLYGALLVKPAVATLGERKAIIVGYIGGALGYWAMGFSKTGLLLWLGIPLLNLMGIAWPSAQSIMSRHTPANQQGLLQGAVNSLRGIAGLIGPLLFTWVFAHSINAKPIFPAEGSAFYVASALILMGLVIASTALAHDAPVAKAAS